MKKNKQLPVVIALILTTSFSNCRKLDSDSEGSIGYKHNQKFANSDNTKKHYGSRSHGSERTIPSLANLDISNINRENIGAILLGLRDEEFKDSERLRIESQAFSALAKKDIEYALEILNTYKGPGRDREKLLTVIFAASKNKSYLELAETALSLEFDSERRAAAYGLNSSKEVKAELSDFAKLLTEGQSEPRYYEIITDGLFYHLSEQAKESEDFNQKIAKAFKLTREASEKSDYDSFGKLARKLSTKAPFEVFTFLAEEQSDENYVDRKTWSSVIFQMMRNDVQRTIQEIESLPPTQQNTDLLFVATRQLLSKDSNEAYKWYNRKLIDRQSTGAAEAAFAIEAIEYNDITTAQEWLSLVPRDSKFYLQVSKRLEKSSDLGADE